MNLDALVKKYLSVKYSADGKTIAEGLNCWTFVKSFYADIGFTLIDIEDFASSCPIDRKSDLVSEYHSYMVEVASPETYDLILMSFEGSLHVGIYLGKDRFIHMCRAGVGVCRLGSSRPPWKKHVLGYYRRAECVA